MASANQIRKLRTARQLSQTELGELCGLSKWDISRLENGDTQMTTERALTLSRALGVGLEDVLGLGTQSRTDPDIEPYDAAPSDPFTRLIASKDERLFSVLRPVLDEHGMLEGDVCLADIRPTPVDQLEAGAIVVATLPSAKAKLGTYIARQFVKPLLLITNSRRLNLPPLHIVADDVRIVGIMRSWHRRLLRSSRERASTKEVVAKKAT